jgi:hypothetical protein
MAKQLNKLWASSKVIAAGARQPEGKTGKTGPAKPSPEQVNAERMARGRSLAADPNYPTDEILATLSEMLARHWYS